MPQPRRLTDFTERDVLADYRAANGARGTVARLAAKYGLTWQGMKVVLTRLERVTKIHVSRGPTVPWPATCSICGARHIRLRPNGRPQSYCHECHAAYFRKTRRKYSQLPPAARLKSNARAYTRVLIKRGKIVQQPCARCADTSAEAHHTDYSNPREVTWLCRPCHLGEHRPQKPVAMSEQR